MKTPLSKPQLHPSSSKRAQTEDEEPRCQSITQEAHTLLAAVTPRWSHGDVVGWIFGTAPHNSPTSPTSLASAQLHAPG